MKTIYLIRGGLILVIFGVAMLVSSQAQNYYKTPDVLLAIYNVFFLFTSLVGFVLIILGLAFKK